MSPNLFNFATSELSQDAFFCWLISWADQKYAKESPEMHACGKDFIHYILAKFGDRFSDLDINTVETKRQYKNVDFLAFLNDKVIVLFEDKVRTKHHSDQLARYAQRLQEEFPDRDLACVYIKADYAWKKEKEIVTENGYEIVELVHLKEALSREAENEIYKDYRRFIINKLDCYESYDRIPVEKWSIEHYFGFYRKLREPTDYLNFDRHYKGNMHWFMIDWRNDVPEGCSLSLEIFSKALVIKGHLNDSSIDRGLHKRSVSEALLNAYGADKVVRSNRKGKISIMVTFKNFPVVDDESGLVDLEGSVAMINQAKEIFKTISVDSIDSSLLSAKPATGTI